MLTRMETTPERTVPLWSVIDQVPELHLSRRLTWHACHNVRDLGGLPLPSGGSTRWRALVRADDLCRLTAEGQAALVSYGIRTIVDLRAHFELPEAVHPYRPPFSGNPIYLHLPPAGDEIAPSRRIVSAPSRKASYRRALELRRPRYAAILSAIARAPEGGVLVHCISGKDRTGLVVALLLALLGVPDTLIAEDYALSGLYLQDTHPEMRDAVSLDPSIRGRMAVERLSHPDTMLDALAFIRQQYGSVEEYLAGADVTEEDMQLLQARMT